MSLACSRSSSLLTSVSPLSLLACFSSIAGSPSEEVEVDRPAELGPLGDSSPVPAVERPSCGGISPSSEISEASWENREDDTFLARLRRLRVGGSRLRDAAPRSRARTSFEEALVSAVLSQDERKFRTRSRDGVYVPENIAIAEDRCRLDATKEIVIVALSLQTSR